MSDKTDCQSARVKNPRGEVSHDQITDQITLDNWLEAERESARLKTEERSPVSRLASEGGREGRQPGLEQPKGG